MSSRRTTSRTFAFDCDRCSTSIDTEKFDFGRALNVAKADGWQAVRQGEQWTHLCAACAPDRD